LKIELEVGRNVEPEDENDLAQLASMVERGVLPDLSENAPHRLIGFPPNAILYRGAALELHRDLSLRLSKSALQDSGHVPRSVEILLDGFVQEVHTAGLQAALTRLDAELSASLEEWTFLQELRFFAPNVRFQVGPTTVVPDLDDVEPGLSAVYAPMASDMRSPFIFTTVRARDEFSARLLSREAFAEAEAVIALLAGFTEIPDVRHMSVNSPVDHYSTGAHATPQIQGVDAAGNLWPGYRELSDSFSRPSDRRTDWEQRTLAATRWFRVASTSIWPAQSISASMSTLECLLVKSTERGNKRVPISNRTSDIGVLRGRTKADQVAWLQDLYGRRNDAVHAGVFYRDEVDASALLVLVEHVVRTSIHHLDPMHGGPNGGACTSIDEVLGSH
jgi:hypothetical protein